MSDKKTFKIGNVVLPVRDNLTDDDKEFVPKSHDYIDDSTKLLEKLALAIRENYTVLLQGETGTGKTSAFRYLANKTNTPFRRMNLNGSTTTDEFVGKIMINKDGTYWIDGELTDAMRKGHWLLVDEVNAALPEILFVLQSLLDDDGFIVLSDKDGEVVRPHPDFRIFATMNPSDTYAGTKEMNKALMSRFTMMIDVNFPSKKQEVEILTQRTGVDEETVEQIVDFANTLRESYKKGDIDYIMSPRDLISWLTVSKHMPSIKKAAEITVLGKCNEDDKKVVSDLMRVTLSLTTDVKVDETLNYAKLVSYAKSGTLMTKLQGKKIRINSANGRIKMFTTASIIVPVGFVTEVTGEFVYDESTNPPIFGIEVKNLPSDDIKKLPNNKVVLADTSSRQKVTAERLRLRLEQMEEKALIIEILSDEVEDVV